MKTQMFKLHKRSVALLDAWGTSTYARGLDSGRVKTIKHN